jgi:hypothetical protein
MTPFETADTTIDARSSEQVPSPFKMKGAPEEKVPDSLVGKPF